MSKVAKSVVRRKRTKSFQSSMNDIMSSNCHWRVDDVSQLHDAIDIDGGLAADFDGSLSGLGVELGAGAYNMRYVIFPSHSCKRTKQTTVWLHLLTGSLRPIAVNQSR